MSFKNYILCNSTKKIHLRKVVIEGIAIPPPLPAFGCSEHSFFVIGGVYTLFMMKLTR